MHMASCIQNAAHRPSRQMSGGGHSKSISQVSEQEPPLHACGNRQSAKLAHSKHLLVSRREQSASHASVPPPTNPCDAHVAPSRSAPSHVSTPCTTSSPQRKHDDVSKRHALLHFSSPPSG